MGPRFRRGLRRSTKFFIEFGLGGEDDSVARLIMQAALTMAAGYHTPVDFWLNLPLAELHQWAVVAKDMPHG